MKKNILLTRPIEDSLNLETKIKEIGFNVIISPMLVVKKIRAYPIKKTKIVEDVTVNGTLGLLLQGSNIAIYPGGEEVPISTAAEASTN